MRRNGRAATPRYKAWEARAILDLRGAPAVLGPVEVEYSYRRPDRRRRDLGNLEKATSDLLVRGGVIEDDSLISTMILRWVDEQDAAVVITVAGK